jgi:hypothetical protein
VVGVVAAAAADLGAAYVRRRRGWYEPALGAEAELRRLLGEAGRDGVHARVLTQLPVFDVETAAIHQLRDKLAGLDAALGDDGVLAVDITGGTTPMSLVTYLAAVGAQIPVTYTTTSSPQGTRDPAVRRYKGLVALHDPVGALTGTPRGTESP